jgi:hypothetical protein
MYLAKRNWNGCKKCAYCDEEETLEFYSSIISIRETYGNHAVWLTDFPLDVTRTVADNMIESTS